MEPHPALAVSVPLRGSGDESYCTDCNSLELRGVVSVPLRGSGDERVLAINPHYAFRVNGFSPLAGKW